MRRELLEVGRGQPSPAGNRRYSSHGIPKIPFDFFMILLIFLNGSSAKSGDESSEEAILGQLLEARRRQPSLEIRAIQALEFL